PPRAADHRERGGARRPGAGADADRNRDDAHAQAREQRHGAAPQGQGRAAAWRRPRRRARGAQDRAAARARRRARGLRVRMAGGEILRSTSEHAAMTITKQEFLLRARVDQATLTAWIEEEWLIPASSAAEPEFTEIDVARAGLIRDLKHDLDVN